MKPPSFSLLVFSHILDPRDKLFTSLLFPQGDKYSQKLLVQIPEKGKTSREANYKGGLSICNYFISWTRNSLKQLSKEFLYMLG